MDAFLFAISFITYKKMVSRSQPFKTIAILRENSADFRSDNPHLNM